MLRKNGYRFLGSLSFAAVLFCAASPVHAEDASLPAPKAKESSPLNLAGLSAALQAASNRKQTGPEVTLKKDAYLHSRPTGPAMRSGVLPAGTVLHKSKNQVMNSSGTWRHVETREGLDGWMYELDLDP